MKAEWPLPTTRTRAAGVARALGAEHVGDAVEDAVRRRRALAERRQAVAPSGFGVAQVPEASITALASDQLLAAVGALAAATTNGASSRPVGLHLVEAPPR